MSFESGKRVESGKNSLERLSPQILKYLKLSTVGLDAATLYSQSKGGYVFIAAGGITVQDLVDNFSDPEMVLQSNNSKEPVYVSLKHGNFGRNEDGSVHGGYFVMDPVSMKIIDIVERDGSSRVN